MKLEQNKEFEGERLLGWKTIEIMHIHPFALSKPKQGSVFDWAKYYVSCAALCKADGMAVTLAMVDIENAIETGEYILGTDAII